jgi:hypothetical protein
MQNVRPDPVGCVTPLVVIITWVGTHFLPCIPKGPVHLATALSQDAAATQILIFQAT